MAGDDHSAPERLLLASAARMLFESESATSFLFHDHLGSVTLRTDSAGQVLGRQSYYPYGAQRRREGDVGRFGFTGQQQDQASGLLHFAHRYLDPACGRWLSPDPLFAQSTTDNIGKLGESTTAHAYVSNNPVMHVDPDGLGQNSPTTVKVQKAARKLKNAHGEYKKAKMALKKEAHRLAASAIGEKNAAKIMVAGEIIGRTWDVVTDIVEATTLNPLSAVSALRSTYKLGQSVQHADRTYNQYLGYEPFDLPEHDDSGWGAQARQKMSDFAFGGDEMEPLLQDGLRSDD